MGLTTLGTQVFLSFLPYVARPLSVFILCTQCCQASLCFYLVYPMLPGQYLFLSCVPNVARPISVFILCTQCCQARVCFYLVYPMLSGPCLFLSCVPNVARSVSVFILCTQCCLAGYTRYKQTRAWQHWAHKIKTDTDLATLGTQDKNRHGPGNIGYTR
jgi:hypothetical protein